MFTNRKFFPSPVKCMIWLFIGGAALAFPALGQTPKSTAKPKNPEPAAHFRLSDFKSAKLTKLEALLRKNAVSTNGFPFPSPPSLNKMEFRSSRP